jgi:ribonuclease HI
MVSESKRERSQASFAAGDHDRRRALKEARAPVIAIDLGFSEKAATCGVAWRSDAAKTEIRATTFAECVSLVAELIRRGPAGEVALILEAPLSGCFNAEGNPIARDFDAKRGDGRSLESGRGWYYGAGASVTLAAVFFLRRLRDALAATDADVTVSLFEGFVTFKQQATEHTDDARRLLEHFVSDDGAREVRAPAGGTLVTVLDLLGAFSRNAPLVLMPETLRGATTDEPVHRVVVYADGASRGNPGDASFGVVVLDESNVTLDERFDTIGNATNNVAEWRALIAGLEAASTLGATHVVVRMDSELVIRQSTGEYRVKEPLLKELASRARSLRSAFRNVSFEHVPRAKNARADALANRALDESPTRAE